METSDIYIPNRLHLITKNLFQLHSSSIVFENEFDLEGMKNHYIKRLKSLNAKIPKELDDNILILETAMKKLFTTYNKN